MQLNAKIGRAALLVLLPAALLLGTTEVAAWNAAGHRLSAYIAWQHLDGNTQTKIYHLLRQHPDHDRWVSRDTATPVQLAAFLGASIWPDEIRSDKRFHEAGDDPTPRLPGFPDMERHRQWHYVDRPIGHHPEDRSKGELDQRLPALIDTLRGHDELQRSYALPWLIHLTADAHQPLHVVSRYDANGKSDEGGNRLTVATPLHPRLPSMNLHAYWDDLPGPPWLRGERLEREARAITEEHPAQPPTGTSDHWISESEKLARRYAYPENNGTAPTINAAFNEQARKITRQQIAYAGYRLGALLKELFARR